MATTWSTWGVMVPAEKILQTARDEKCDIIGLSGLITPSLDEMVHVAREMQRQGFRLPLMIGGATTSKAHTAVKIDPHYNNDAVVYVTDASRAVGVATTLLSKELKPAFVDKTRDEYAVIRERTANRSARTERLTYAEAIAVKPKFDWAGYSPVKPTFTGRRVLEDIDLRTLVDYIDWTPFFISLGPGRQVPAHPGGRGRRGGRYGAVQRCPGDAEQAHRRQPDQGPCGVRLLAGQSGRRR